VAGPALTDVPDRYDIVFQLNDGTTYGFLFSDAVQSSLPFRTHKATYGYSATFLERQNVSSTYGDNFADFFLTGAQADFSEGEGQHFFRVNDQDSVRKYWAGSNIDPVRVPGNVTLTPAITTITQASVTAVTAGERGWTNSDNFVWWLADGTNLYSVDTSGTITSKGAHGAGVVADMTTDGNFVYLAGSSGVRSYDTTTYATFSAESVNKLVFLNNILYAYEAGADALLSFDTSGIATTQYAWKNAKGGTNTNGLVKSLAVYGGSIYILRVGISAAELWTYDGAGCRKLADLPPDFYVSDMCVNVGIVYISGYLRVKSSGQYFPQVYYYSNGAIGKLWDSNTSYTTTEGDVGICPFGDGVVFCDTSTNNILHYSLPFGGVHTIVGAVAHPVQKIVCGNVTSAFLMFNSAQADKYLYDLSDAYNSTGYLETSQYDFDNTLTKFFRGVKIDADIPANTSIDIAYRLDGAGGSYTTLKTGAASGVEYDFPATTTGHSLSAKITLNSTNSAVTPTLKRVYVRAAPMLQQFRNGEYIIDLSSGIRAEAGRASRRCRDGTPYPYTSDTAAKNLQTVATQTVPFTVCDRFSAPTGFTAIADLQQNSAGYDGFAIYEERPGVYLARINIREV
jgi:hypothetical protein